MRTVVNGERLAADLAAVGVPTIASLSGSATADGGDMFWIDDATLAVGRSYRTNAVAVAQLEEILRPRGVRVEVYDVPHDQGPEWCLHLMSVVSPVREDLAVVYERLAPVAMLEELRRRILRGLLAVLIGAAPLPGHRVRVAPAAVAPARANNRTREDAGAALSNAMGR